MVHVIGGASTHVVHVQGSAILFHTMRADEDVVLGEDVATIGWHSVH